MNTCTQLSINQKYKIESSFTSICPAAKNAKNAGNVVEAPDGRGQIAKNAGA